MVALLLVNCANFKVTSGIDITLFFISNKLKSLGIAGLEFLIFRLASIHFHINQLT